MYERSIEYTDKSFEPKNQTESLMPPRDNKNSQSLGFINEIAEEGIIMFVGSNSVGLSFKIPYSSVFLSLQILFHKL